jgi:hypothetical protein
VAGSKRKRIIFAKTITMSTYVVNINEKSKLGRLVSELLSQLEDNKNLKISSIQEYELMEEKVLRAEMKKADKTPLLSYKETKAELAKLKTRLAKK